MYLRLQITKITKRQHHGSENVGPYHLINEMIDGSEAPKPQLWLSNQNHKHYSAMKKNKKKWDSHQMTQTSK